MHAYSKWECINTLHKCGKSECVSTAFLCNVWYIIWSTYLTFSLQKTLSYYKIWLTKAKMIILTMTIALNKIIKYGIYKEKLTYCYINGFLNRNISKKNSYFVGNKIFSGKICILNFGFSNFISVDCQKNPSNMGMEAIAKGWQINDLVERLS